jgi:FMN phosphatase YigB (HAD superfamily)
MKADLSDVRVVSWDLDGTLYSRARLKAAVARHFLAAPLQRWSELRALLRRQRASARVRTTGGYSTAPSAADVALEARWLGPALRRVGPHEGVHEALGLVRRAGLPQVLFSDFTAGFKLAALGVEHYFDAVYEGELLGALKPNPLGLTRIASDLGVSIGAVLHIGDRPDTDEAAALAAGARCLILGRDVPDFPSLAKVLSTIMTKPSPRVPIVSLG